MSNRREKFCKNCANFVRLNPDDMTAPEGTCQLKEWPAPWPMSYWPSMLAGDYCLNGFKEAGRVGRIARSMPNIVPDLRAANARARSGIVGLGDGALYAEAAAEIERLRKIETAARALQFSAYPAHGSGFVTQVHGGNINDLEAALAARKE